MIKTPISHSIIVWGDVFNLDLYKFYGSNADTTAMARLATSNSTMISHQT
jgi:hypothetical protein